MLRKLLLTAATFVFVAASGHASVTINANAVSNLILSSSGITLANGDIVRIGSFSDTSSLGTNNSFASLNALFTPFGEGGTDGDSLSESGNSGNTMDINNYGTTGGFLGSYSGINANYMSVGTQLYLWVFNVTSLSALNSATQWGIYDESAWTFPNGSVSVGTTTLSVNSSVSVVRGSTVVMNGATDYELANIPASVPEPASLAGIGSLLALGSAAFLRRRKVA